MNTICQRFVKREQVSPTNTTLLMWNKSTLAPLGIAMLATTNPKCNNASEIQYVVVPNDYSSLLGIKAAQDMGLLTVHRDRFVSVGQLQATSLGDLGTAKLYIDPEARPRILPCRRIPFAIQSDVKTELEKLVDRGVLVPVVEPSTWVSQMAVARKADGRLRICIDQQPLNEALQRQHYQLPILADVLPKLHNSRLFSKLDVKEAFWHIKLDLESSMLTTMITPFGRFRWARLPFGLCVSSEVFQKTLNDAIGDLQGVICVADDLVVIGSGQNDEEAERNHFQNLQDLQKRCEERNIQLNNDKVCAKTETDNFHGPPYYQ